VLERFGLLKQRSILIDFRGKHQGFDFDFFWIPIYGQYTGLTKKVLTVVAFSPVHTCPTIVADFCQNSRRFGNYSGRNRPLYLQVWTRLLLDVSLAYSRTFAY